MARLYAPPAPSFAWQPGDVITFDASGMPVITRAVGSMSGQARGVPGSKTLATRTDTVEVAEFSVAQIMAEAQKAAASAEAQLEGDVAQIKAINGDRRQFNHIVIAVATYATGKDIGQTAKEWRDALAAEKKSGKETARLEKPTVTEIVPLAYQPVIVPRLYFMKMTSTFVDT